MTNNKFMQKIGFVSNSSLGSKLRDLIRSITNKSENYDKKHLKKTFNLDDDLPLMKTLERDSSC